MNPKSSKTPIRLRLIASITCLSVFAGCATTPQTARGPEYAPTADMMREARSASVPVEKRAADYLQAAAMTTPLLGSGAQETPARDTYNAACGELTVLLRTSEGGQLWNHPLTLAGNNQTYHLRLEPASSAVWAPNYFTTLQLEGQVKQKLIRKENIQEGVGGFSIHPKSSRHRRESPRRLRPPSIFTQRMPRSRSVTRPTNRRRVLKAKFVPWLPISQRRSATTSRRPIFC